MNEEAYILVKDLERQLKVIGLQTRNDQELERIKQVLKTLDNLNNIVSPVSVESSYNEKEEIFALSYISCSNIPSENLSLEIDKIIKVAQSRNNLFGVTGCLVYRSGYFVQYIEGSKYSIDYLYGMISRDPRHGKITVLSRGVVASRNFENWSMEFKTIDGKNDALLDKVEIFKKAEQSTTRFNQKEVLTLISTLKNLF